MFGVVEPSPRILFATSVLVEDDDALLAGVAEVDDANAAPVVEVPAELNVVKEDVAVDEEAAELRDVEAAVVVDDDNKGVDDIDGFDGVAEADFVFVTVNFRPPELPCFIAN